MRTLSTMSSAFSQNAGSFEAIQNRKLQQYLNKEAVIAKQNALHIEELLLLPEEQAFAMLSKLREQVANAEVKYYLTFPDISEYWRIILSLSIKFYNGETDFMGFGENLTLINFFMNKEVKSGLLSVRLKKVIDTKRVARNLRKNFKSNYTEDLMEIITLVIKSFKA